jgi:hypothetical protein
MNNSDPIYSQTVLDMFTVANEYCIFVEKAGSYPSDEIFQYLAKVFSLMYLKGSLIPKLRVEYPEANERFVTEEQWQDVFNELKNKFGEDDIFLSCDPGEADAEPERHSLAENLADVYQDMKDFVLLYSKEMQAARENAVHEIGRLFRSHWGHRVLMSQLHLHHLMFREDMEEESY